MALFNNFPWTNFHELNLDWIVQQVKEIQTAFPEGLVGIPKGGTGADNPADARANLGVYATEIPMSSLDDQVIADVLENLAGQLNTLEENIKYKIFRSVHDIGLIPGAPTISSVWTAMSAGEMLACPPDELAANECPETYGTLLMIRSGGNSGCCLFFGADHQYRKNYVNNYPSGSWDQIFSQNDIIPVSKGGTGASTPQAARQNLGIDFSGTVLSVSNVGADTAGNVPLKWTDVDNIITSVTQLELTTGNPITTVWNLMPAKSLAFIPSSEISNSPTGKNGTIIIYKQSSSAGTIEFKGITPTDGDFRMYLINDALTNLWEQDTGIDLLWTNANPTQSFSGQTIAIDLSEYRLVMVLFTNSLGEPYFFDVSCPINEVARAERLLNITSHSTVIAAPAARGMNPKTNEIVFENCVVRGSVTDTGPAIANNTCLIPQKIYGIR